MATVESAPQHLDAHRARPRRALPPPPALAGLAVGALLFGVFAAARWTGVIPFGSDNDEYPLVARALLDSGTPVIAGVEATKYPLGYPLVLALFEALRLPALTGIVLNFVLVAATAFVMVKALERTHTRFARFAAASFVLVSTGLWGAATSFMPDVMITFLSALLLAAVVRMRSVNDVVVVSVIAFVATSMKSVGVLLAGAASTAVLLGERVRRRWFLLPGVAGLLALVVHALIVRPYPEATTGYGRVFWLVNPYDAVEGRATTGQVLERLWTRWDVVLGDWGKAVMGPHVARDLAIALTVALLAAGVWGLGRRWAYGAGLVAIYGAGLALWPFSSTRFGLPMLPLAAVGVAHLAGLAARMPHRVARPAAVAGLCAALAVHGVIGFGEVAEGADSEALTYTAFHEHTVEAAHWASHNIGNDAVVASPAYRELTERMGDRPILPVSYTTDPDTLWAETGGAGAEWFVNLTRLYPRRARVGRTLVRAFPERFEKVFENTDVAIYRITTAAD